MPLVAWLVMVAFVAGCVTPSDTGVRDGPLHVDSPWNVLHFGGKDAPALNITQPSLSGTFGLGFMVSSQSTTECTLQTRSTGVASKDETTVGLAVFSPSQNVGVSVWSTRMGWVDPVVETEAAGIRVGTNTDDGFEWSAENSKKFAVRPSEPTHVIYAALGLAPAILPTGASSRHLGGAPFSFFVACDAAVTAELSYVSAAVPFFDHDLQGGTSASAKGFETTTVQSGSAVWMEVTKGSGYIIVELMGDLLLAHSGVGEVTLHTPEGDQRLLDAPGHGLVEPRVGDVWDPAFRSGGPGPYGVTSTWAGADVMGSFHGLIAEVVPWPEDVERPTMAAAEKPDWWG